MLAVVGVIGGSAIPSYATTATTTTLAVTAGGSATTSVATGTVVTLTATVKAGSTAVHPGIVNFCDATATLCTDIHLLGSAAVNSSGVAVFRTKPAVGSHSYKVVYVGTATYATSNASATLTVTGGSTSTTISQSGSAGSYTLSSSVTGANAGIAPTGMVSFLDTSHSNYSLASAALSGSTSALSLNSLPQTVSKVGVIQILTADFNGDGIPDVAVLFGTNSQGETYSSDLEILTGNGDGTFTAKVTFNPGNSPTSFAAGDVNGDGKVDLLVSETTGPSTSGQVAVWLGNGDGTFSSGATIATDVAPSALVMADFNGDGNLDAVVSNVNAGNLTILFGNGDGTFTAYTTPRSVYSDLSQMAVGDFNNDGKPDLVLNTSSGVLTLLGTGTASASAFSTGATITGSQAQAIAVADLNGDGKPDIAIAGGSSATIYVGNNSDTFTAGATLSFGASLYPRSMVVADINGDGIADVVAANTTVVYFLGEGSGTFASQVSYTPPTPDNQEQADYLAAADVNGDGITDVVTGNFLGSSNMDGVFALISGVTTTATASVSGLSVTGAGTHTVEASYPGNTYFSSSVSGTTSLTGSKVATSTVVTYSPTRVGVGGTVTLTATVTPNTSQGYTASGTVTFYNGMTNLGTETLMSGVATLTTSTLPQGTDTVTAIYAGDNSFASSTSSAVTITVLATPTVTLTVKSGSTVVTSVPVDMVVTLTATVMNGATAVTRGFVNFCNATAINCNDFHRLGTASLLSGGTATYKFKPGVGGHSYKAVFESTPTYGVASSAASALAVTGAATTTTIAQSGSTGNYTLTSTTVGVAGSSAPTGTVSFEDSSNSNQTVATAAVGAATNAVTFNLNAYYNVGSNSSSSPHAVATGDFNNDGIPDVAVVNTGSYSVTILLGKGDGTFNVGSSFSTIGTQPVNIATGDFNGDGNIDLAIADGTYGVTILLGNGNGTFTAHSAPALTTAAGIGSAIVAADFNGDGLTDLAVTSTSLSSVTVFTSNGDGTFSSSATIPLPDPAGFLAVGDFNNDGFPDLVISGGSVDLNIALNNGAGTAFTVVQAPSIDDCGGLVAADFNGDGNTDVAFSVSYGYNVQILLGDGTGHIVNTGTSYPVSYSTHELVMGDFNGDGNVDLATNGYPVTFLLGHGDGTFTSVDPSYYTEYYVYGLATADFNGDGVSDLVGPYADSGEAFTYLSVPTNTVTATATGVAVAGTGTHNVLASYPGNSYFSASSSATTALTAAAITDTLALTTSAGTSSSYGESVTLTATLNPTAVQGHSPTGTVTFYSGSTVLTTTNFTNGVATYTTTALAQGTDTLKVVYAGDTNFAGATSNLVMFNVTAALAGLTVSGIPANASASTAYSFSVTATGSGGTTTTGYTGTVALSSTDSTATLVPASYTFTTADAGVHTFVATFNNTGTWSVTATAGTISGTESGIHVTGYYVWLVNANGTVDKISTAGSGVTGAVGASGAASSKGGVAFDHAGDVWSVTSANNTLDFVTATGTGAASYSGGGLNSPVSVAVDGAGQIWIANSGNASVSAFKNSGANLSGNSGLAKASIGSSPSGVAVDSSGGVWVTSGGGGSVTHIVGAAIPVVAPTSSAVANGTLGSEP